MYYNQSVETLLRIGILPGTFNPPTRAHLALAEAGLRELDQVIFVLPRNLPHKEYSGVSFEQRRELLLSAIRHEPRYTAAFPEAGLFIDIARELRPSVHHEAQLVFLCGRDAAERIVNWDYGSPGAFTRMLEEFHLWVASRNGDYLPPATLQSKIKAITPGIHCDHISATEVRERILRSEPWKELVPETIADEVYRLYGSTAG